MKTQEQLQSCFEGRIKDTMKKCKLIYEILNETPRNAEIAKKMPKIRANLAELNQSVHEMNAYMNCLHA